MHTGNKTPSGAHGTLLVLALAGTVLSPAALSATSATDVQQADVSSSPQAPFHPGRAVAQQTITVGEGPSPSVLAERRKSQMEKRAEVLLDKAVAHIRTHGRAGAAAFSSSPDFIDRDLYVFALGTDGVMLGSGGWSAPMVGQNVLDEVDSQGKPFFREMLRVAKENGKGQVEYQWYNPADSESTLKTSNVVQVGDVVVGVGYYVERATRAEARKMLRNAAATLQKDTAAALKAFQDPSGPFNEDDLYVFVVDTEEERFVAHGGIPSLVGTNAFKLQDAAGRNVVREMVQLAKSGDQNTLDYLWVNPLTGRIESKRTYFMLQDRYLVGVGSYNRR